MKSGSAGCRNTSSARFHIHTTLQLSINLSYVGLTDKYMNFQELNLPNALLRALRDKERTTHAHSDAGDPRRFGRQGYPRYGPDGYGQDGGLRAACSGEPAASAARRPRTSDPGADPHAHARTGVADRRVARRLRQVHAAAYLRRFRRREPASADRLLEARRRRADSYAGASARLDRAGAYLVEADRIFRT